jgi:pimeloyl-ACP methyl ester carboxylesterase
MTTEYGYRVTAATLMQGLRPHVAEIDGVRTRYWLGGEGPPLVLIHGLGGASYNFTRLAPLLARRRQVLVPDLPGHCGTEPLRSVDSVSDLAAHVARVAELERMVPTAVLGYSMGGLVALRLAVGWPRHVSALALVAAAGIVSATRRAEIWALVVGMVRPARFVARFRGAIVRRPFLRYPAFGYWGAVHPGALSPEAVLGFLEGPLLHTDVGSAGRALVKDDPRPDLDGVRCPALLIWGARDRLVPLSDGFEYARRLRCPIRTIPAAGHLVVGEYPEACARIVEEFLDGVGEVDELPLEGELLGELRGERADT